MEQRRIAGKSHWYHETQSSASRVHALPLVPEAATVNDPFLLDLTVPDDLHGDVEAIAAPARKLYALLFPQRIQTTRLRTFSAYDRLSTALTVAQVFGVQRLCNHYAARLAPLAAPDSSRESNCRLAQITQYARQLAASPSVIDTRARQQLEEVGLTLFDIVLFNQIVGFIAFQARVLAILQALLGQPVRYIPGMETQPPADASLFADENAGWQPAIEGVDPRVSNAAQMGSLAHWQPLPELRQLAPLLAHEHLLLNELGEICQQVNAITPNKTLGWLVGASTARINGSTGCFAERLQRGVHAAGLREALRQGEPALSAFLADNDKERALVQAVQMLTCAPDRFSPAQLAALSEAGFSPQAAFSLLLRCALCGWINRLKIALGEPAA